MAIIIEYMVTIAFFFRTGDHLRALKQSICPKRKKHTESTQQREEEQLSFFASTSGPIVNTWFVILTMTLSLMTLTITTTHLT